MRNILYAAATFALIAWGVQNLTLVYTDLDMLFGGSDTIEDASNHTNYLM